MRNLMVNMGFKSTYPTMTMRGEVGFQKLRKCYTLDTPDAPIGHMPRMLSDNFFQV